MICPVDTKNLSTMKIGSTAHSMVCISHPSQIEPALSKIDSFNNKLFVLGGGSNTIFGDNLENTSIVKIEIPGIEISSTTHQEISIKAGAGEVWDDLVKFCCEKNFQGLENLSYIPGTVGASPVQNIGAYGVEVKDSIEEVHAYDTQLHSFVTLRPAECDFGYRSSIFKSNPGRYLITYVIFKLGPNRRPNVSSYKDVVEYFKDADSGVTISQVRDAIISIRQKKLPNPEQIPNCGSFFKNPIIGEQTAKEIKSNYPSAPIFPYEDRFKIGAGFLIDQCGFKGKSIGKIVVYSKNALVLTNPEGATINDLFTALMEIKNAVRSKFNIDLEEEVNLIGIK